MDYKKEKDRAQHLGSRYHSRSKKTNDNDKGDCSDRKKNEDLKRHSHDSGSHSRDREKEYRPIHRQNTKHHTDVYENHSSKWSEYSKESHYFDNKNIEKTSPKLNSRHSSSDYVHKGVESNRLSKRRKRRRRSSSTSSSDSSSSDSSSETSTSSSSSSTDSEIERRRKRKRKRKKRKMKKLKKRLIKEKKARKKRKSIEKKKRREHMAVVGPVMSVNTKVDKQDSDLATDGKRVLKPMTKEEWETQRNKIRRVFDASTGRHRLIRGEGEIVEEIVSKQRQKEINKQATLGDGIHYQQQAGLLPSK